MTDDLLHDVPPPGAHFSHRSFKRSKENQRLIEREQQRYQKIMDSSQLKKAEKYLQHLQRLAEERNLDELLDEKQRLISEYDKERKRLHKLKLKHEHATDPELCQQLIRDAKIIKRNMAGIREDMREVAQQITPHRGLIRRRDDVRQRISEHLATLEWDQQNKRDTLGMEAEANRFISIIIATLDRLEFCFDTSTRRGKAIRHSVKFDRVCVTPDEIQLKITTSRPGFFGGSIDLLPKGVYASDLIQPRVLNELSGSTERQVISPNQTGDADFSSGIWYRVFRLDHHDGLMEKIYWRQLMSMYNMDDRDRFPIPTGIKTGRVVNWIDMVDHPHILVNGQTGAGKTNLLRVFLSTLISHHSPQEVRFALIDLKRGGDLNPYANTPHALSGVIKTPEAVANLMQQLIELLHERMEEISRITNDITKYNQHVAPENRMPRIVVVFDEYSAIGVGGATLRREIESAAILIATQGRAAGIQFLIGNQQDYSDTVHKMIKSNITLVLGGRQRTGGASMSTFGTHIAKKIKKVPGRMICDNGSDSPFQIQTPLLTDDDLYWSIANATKWQPHAFKLANFEPPKAKIEDVDEDTQEVVTILDAVPVKESPVVDHEFIVRYALEHLEGDLKAVKLWEMMREDGLSVTQHKMREMVREIAQLEMITVDDSSYNIQSVQNFYSLVSLSARQSENEYT